MTRQPTTTRQAHASETHAALARVFGVHVGPADGTPHDWTAPDPADEEREPRAALGRVFGTEA
jgi:hypothetical protein